ncbi:hypothetical protein QQS21_012119 [Conoideocrella luteorostrata]|uniref:ADP-ribosylhydrolase ARH3 n=1 Tax=Conoideocrella luteorostrata TaxID=1105319 RepID=A0AAJ0FT05_9HYPO|nr:hypothetical protein QQS21_012119 [Conoideocrella luteorostrata]
MQDLSRPPGSRHLSQCQSRAVGALLGVHAGDSLGASLEFKTHSQIRRTHPEGLREIIGGGPFSWPAGHATDDTDMTRAVLLAYRDISVNPSSVKDVALLAGDHFLSWYTGDWPGRRRGSRPVDIGGATREGLYKFKKTHDPDKSGAGKGSCGNGSLMRCIPTGLFQRDPQKLIEESMRISRITHTDEKCTISCAVYNRIAGSLVAGTSVEEAIHHGMEVAEQLEGQTSGPVGEAVLLGKRLSIEQMAWNGPVRELKGCCSGYVLESLSLAIAAILDRRSLEDVLVDVVRIGKDTDTNGAVAGGLLGARDGVEAIPARWKDKLQFREEFMTIGLELLKE